MSIRSDQIRIGRASSISSSTKSIVYVPTDDERIALILIPEDYITNQEEALDQNVRKVLMAIEFQEQESKTKDVLLPCIDLQR